MATKKEKKLIEEYRILAVKNAEHARLAALTKAKMNEIEAQFFDKVKEKGTLVIDGSVLTYKVAESVTCSYSAVYRKAVELMGDNSQELTDYKLSISKHNVNESLEVVDAVIACGVREAKKLMIS